MDFAPVIGGGRAVGAMAEDISRCVRHDKVILLLAVGLVCMSVWRGRQAVAMMHPAASAKRGGGDLP